MKDCSISNDDQNTDLTTSKQCKSQATEYQSSYDLDLRETFKLKVIVDFYDDLSKKIKDSVTLQALHCLREDCPEYSLAYSSPNDYFVDPAAEELIKLFSESQEWELDWDLHEGDEIRLHISQAVNAKCVFVDTGKFEPLIKTVQTGVNVVVKCVPSIVRSVTIKLELNNFPEKKLSIEEYIQIDGFLTYWNDDVISPGSIEFSNNYEADMEIFRQGGYKEIRRLWSDKSLHFTKDSESIEIVGNDREKSIFKRHYEGYFLRPEDQIQFSIKSNLKDGHCQLNLVGGLLLMREEMEEYKIIVSCCKMEKRHRAKKCAKMKKHLNTTQKEVIKEELFEDI